MKLSVKILTLSFLLICVSQLSGLGLMFFSDDTAQVFALEDYSVSVRIENQAAVTVVTESFRNSTFLETNPICLLD
ncbi:MAG: hypothetical protein P9L91_00840 [Candidatus Zophobacter franzmannii]|nr:hypothetical protein [Candidatus Zophobacter franzmannii]